MITAPAHDCFVEVKQLHVTFTGGKNPVQAVSGVDLRVQRGEVVALIGESGSGKSVTLRSLLGLHAEKTTRITGDIRVGDQQVLQLSPRELSSFRGRVASMIFQEPLLALDPVYSLGQQITETIRRHENVSAQEAQQRALALFERVRIPSPERRLQAYPHEMSGGMRQRAMIAMALACDPKIIIADEPTTALDVIIQAQILELLNTLRQRLGLAVIFVTHDLGVVAEICDTVLVMYGGVAAEYASVDAVFNLPQHPYTRALLAAFPNFSRQQNALVSIPGQPPRLHALPPGCRFAPRCSSAVAQCHAQQPRLLRVGAEHYASCHLLQPMLPAGSPLPQPA